MPNEQLQLPDGVRQVPGPAVRWQMNCMGMQWDGYVFEDDQSDLAKFMRWLAETEYSRGEPIRLFLQKITG